MKAASLGKHRLNSLTILTRLVRRDVEAAVKDGSAPAYINSALNNNGGGIFGLYTISYKAGSPGQTLKVRYTILNQYFAPNGNIGLKAAILQ